MMGCPFTSAHAASRNAVSGPPSYSLALLQAALRPSIRRSATASKCFRTRTAHSWSSTIRYLTVYEKTGPAMCLMATCAPYITAGAIQAAAPRTAATLIGGALARVRRRPRCTQHAPHRHVCAAQIQDIQPRTGDCMIEHHNRHLVRGCTLTERMERMEQRRHHSARCILHEF